MKNLKVISAAEARKRFAELTDEVRTQGTSYSIVRHGKEVARIVPPQSQEAIEEDFNAAIKQFIEANDNALAELSNR